MLVVGIGSSTSSTLRADEPIHSTEAQAVQPVEEKLLNAVSCAWPPPCDAEPPTVVKRPFRHLVTSLSTVKLGSPHHHGRDQIYGLNSASQWAIAQFSYGEVLKDLEDEDIDVFIDSGCGGAWTKVGTFRTSRFEPGHHAGAKDPGGLLKVDLVAQGQHLKAGRHRVRFVVAGDLSSTECFIEVLPAGARIAVADVDGTLTSSESAVIQDLVKLGNVKAHPDAATVLTTLAALGYRIVYLTGRPDWLREETRNWLSGHGFPSGILHTSVTDTGVDDNKEFENRQLAALKEDTHRIPEVAFGNRESDVQAFAAAGIPHARSYFYRLEGDPHGGQVFQDYASLIPVLKALPSCHSPH